jgi:hypothetical protein
VRRLLPAGVAKLLGLQPLGMLLFVLRRGVVAVFTIPTLQCNDFAHDFLKPFQKNGTCFVKIAQLLDDFGYRAGADGVAAFANGEAQALFERYRSD